MKYLIASFCLLLSSCDTTYEAHCIMADKFASNYIHKQKKLGFRPSSYGGGMMGDIKTFEFGFDIDECLDVKEIRHLIVMKTQELISEINSDIQIRPYLHDYPSTVKNIKLGIGFYNNKKMHLKYPYIIHAQVVRGEILYGLCESESEPRIKDVYENYDEALHAIRNGLPLPPLKPF